MTKAQQITWDQLQSAYRTYCLPSIKGNAISRERALQAIEKAFSNASCYIPAESITVKPVGGF